MARDPDAGPDLAAIARAASEDAGGIPPWLLGGYLPAVLDAAASGRRLTMAELDGYGRSGERAAESGAALKGVVDLYLSATWRLWRELPAPAGAGPSAAVLRAAGLAVLRAADDAVAAAAEGFERAHVSAARREEAERREFAEDLLSGRGSVGDLIARGERLGLRLAGPHQVVLAGPGMPGVWAPGGAVSAVGLEIEAAVTAAAVPSPSLVGTRAGHLVVVVGAAGGGEADRVARALARVLDRGVPGFAARPGAEVAGRRSLPWRVALGRPYAGPGGVVRSYEEAAEALEVARRIGLPGPFASATDLLVYQVLLRDRAAITDLVRTLMLPLERARGGPEPLLATLAAYFARGGVAAAAARDLHLSVRAVTYRLARVAELTGRDPADPDGALALRVAVIGAQMLDWPATPLEPA